MPAMLSLNELQRQFMAALYDEAAPGPIASIAGNGLAPDARLRIYRRSCNEMQAAALRTSYPAVLALVGEEWFDQTVRDYRCAHPSRSGNLQGYGAYLADYLEPLSACHSLPYLPDVARLEWLRQQAILADDPGSVTPDTFVENLSDAGERPGIRLHPSVHFLESVHPILTIWRYAMQPSREPLTLSGNGENVMLWREGAEVVMAALDQASFACATALAKGHSLYEACIAATALDSDFDLAELIESLLRCRVIVGLSPSEASFEGRRP